jgi:hypothetical protein
MQRIPGFSDVFDYAVDAAQRSVLFWDTPRERGNEYRRHNAAGNPPLLKFGYELLLDERTLEPPCNYALLGSVAKFDTAGEIREAPYWSRACALWSSSLEASCQLCQILSGVTQRDFPKRSLSPSSHSISLAVSKFSASADL